MFQNECQVIAIYFAFYVTLNGIINKYNITYTVDSLIKVWPLYLDDYKNEMR